MNWHGGRIEIYLFDWGDTLMVDFPGVSGKMCDWDIVEAVDGAQEVLEHLARHAQIYIATGAAESTELDIGQAFDRVGLGRFISGYFCKANLGVSKGSALFFPTILARLGKPATSIAMVGDSLVKDIEPAAAVGIKPIWLASGRTGRVPSTTQIISHLRELCA
jgi:putative hydrolase of the HAD superfamily